MNEGNRRLVDLMAGVWGSIAGLCDGLGAAEWGTATDCPGWSVQDQVSHLAGSEAGILGDPEPEHTPGEEVLAHTRSEQGRRNEVVVDWRRSWDGAQVLSDFRALTGRRLAVLRAMTDADFAVEMDTPVGVRPVSEFLSIRIMDAWVHEQDIRRALGRPGGWDGPAAAHALGRIMGAMPYVAARRAQAPDGATVVLEVTGAGGRVVPIGVSGGRGRELAEAPADPTVRVTLDAEAFGCLGCGRWDAGEVLRSGRVVIEGDLALGELMVRGMNIMP